MAEFTKRIEVRQHLRVKDHRLCSFLEGMLHPRPEPTELHLLSGQAIVFGKLVLLNGLRHLSLVILVSGFGDCGAAERLTNEPHTRLRYFCSPQHTDSALYPIINQMERAANFLTAIAHK